MLPADYLFTPEEIEVRRILRHTFLNDETSRLGLAVILRKLGTWSSDPCPSPHQAGLKAFGMQILEDLGTNHEANELAMVIALSQIPPVEAEVKSRRSDE